jgi:hypothetical protein
MRNGPKILKIFMAILSAIASNRSNPQAKDVQKLHQKHAEGVSLKESLYVEFVV